MPLGEEVFSWYEEKFGAANFSTRILVMPTDEGYLSPTGLLKPIPCFEPYVISRNGECFYLYSVSDSLYVRPVKPFLSRNYWKVGLSHPTGLTQQLVHRLVAMAWLPDYTDDLIVDHIDRNKTNNDYSNLRMVTYVMNTFNTLRKKHFFNSNTGMWEVKFTLDGKKRDFGAYKNEAVALAKLKEIEVALCARKKI